MFKRFLSIGAATLGLSALALVAVPTAGNAATCTFGAIGSGPLQGVLDGITTAPTAGTSSVNVATDCLDDGIDSNWSITGAGGSVATIIIELAGFANGNEFGVYDPSDPTQQVVIFTGAASMGAQAVLSFQDNLDGTASVLVNFVDSGVDFALSGGNDLFGYFLDSSSFAGGGFWHSDTDLNSDGVDHMYAYQGNNTDTIDADGPGGVLPGTFTDDEFILAFEDLNCAIGCDQDYTDFVVIVESIEPIPEPTTLALFGAGLLGLGFLARRRKSRAA